MSKKKYKDTYVSELYNVEETIEIFKKCPADIWFKLYHKIRKELDSTGGGTVKNPTLSQRIDKLETTVENLVDAVNKGFKQVNERLDEHDRRFDRIEQRLDYNGLKNLPKTN